MAFVVGFPKGTVMTLAPIGITTASAMLSDAERTYPAMRTVYVGTAWSGLFLWQRTSPRVRGARKEECPMYYPSKEVAQQARNDDPFVYCPASEPFSVDDKGNFIVARHCWHRETRRGNIEYYICCSCGSKLQLAVRAQEEE